MPTIDLGRVKGDTGAAGASMRIKGSWTPNTNYVNDSQYIDVVTNDGNSYACKISHTSDSIFSDINWDMIAQKGGKGDDGEKGDTPIIKIGTVETLEPGSDAVVTSDTSEDNTVKLNFGIPKGADGDSNSELINPEFDDTTDIYETLDDANNAAELTVTEIKSKANLFTILSNMKKSFSAIVQGLKILGTNVGAIKGITTDLNTTEEGYAADMTALAQLNSDISVKYIDYIDVFQELPSLQVTHHQVYIMGNILFFSLIIKDIDSHTFDFSEKIAEKYRPLTYSFFPIFTSLSNDVNILLQPTGTLFVHEDGRLEGYWEKSNSGNIYMYGCWLFN